MRVITVGLIFILIVGVIAPIQSDCIPIMENDAISILDDHLFLESHDTNDTIRIDRNSDFEYYGYSGNGTPENPYIIEELNMYMKYSPQILIENTDAFFIIRNCTIQFSGIIWTGGSPSSLNEYPADVLCISFSNVTNGEIRDCEMYSVSKGIRLENSINCTIEGTSLHDIGYAIELRESTSCTISSNYINNSIRSMIFDQCTENSVEDNRIFYSPGIYIEDSGDNRFSGNEMSGGFSFHFWPGYLPNNISNNALDGKEILYLQSQHDETVTGDDYGQIILAECNNVHITNGKMTNSSQAVYIFNSENCRISEFNIEGSGGFYIQGSQRIDIISCVINSHSEGVYASHSNELTVEDCTISTEYWYGDGIDIYKSTNVIIKNCSLSYGNLDPWTKSLDIVSDYCIYEINKNVKTFTPALSLIIDYNSGIRCYSVSNFLITSNTITDYRTGMGIAASSNGIISYNEISGTDFEDIYMYSSEENVTIIEGTLPETENETTNSDSEVSDLALSPDLVSLVVVMWAAAAIVIIAVVLKRKQL